MELLVERFQWSFKCTVLAWFLLYLQFSIVLISKVCQSLQKGLSLPVRTYCRELIKKNLPRPISANSNKFYFCKTSRVKIEQKSVPSRPRFLIHFSNFSYYFHEIWFKTWLIMLLTASLNIRMLQMIKKVFIVRFVPGKRSLAEKS